MDRCQYGDYASCRYRKYFRICVVVKTIYEYANVKIVVVYIIVRMIGNPCHYSGQHKDRYQYGDYFGCLPISRISETPCHSTCGHVSVGNLILSIV